MDKIIFDIDDSMFGDGSKTISIANIFDSQKEAEVFVAKLQSLLNTEQKVQESDTTKAGGSNTASNINQNSDNSIEQELKCRVCKKIIDEDYHRWGVCFDCYEEQ